MAPTSMRRIGPMALLALGFVMMAAPAAGASCAEPLPLDEALAGAEIVFVGTVSDVQHDGRLAGFVVDEVWKGEVAAKVLVSGGPSPADLEATDFGETIVTSVDRNFERGERYLVVPFGVEEGVYMDNACSVTQIYDPGLDDFRPASAHAPVEAGSDGGVLTARIALGALVVIGAGALVVARSRRREATAAG